MDRFHALAFLVSCSVACSVAGDLGAQDVGSRRSAASMPEAAPPDPATIGQFIVVEGSAEVRADPTEVRIVLAVAAEGADAATCRRHNTEVIDALRQGLQGAGVTGDAIHVDFIALTPVYEWNVERQHEQNVAVEKRAALRLQENVHVRVADVATVPAVRAAAFDAGVSDVVAFDYGCADVDRVKDEALRRALENAKRKADLLLGATFGDARPPLLNVRERVDVYLPPELYRTYVAESSSVPYWVQAQRDLPMLAARRPLTTYYHGFDGRVDQVGGGLPMRPQLSVVGRAWLYYRPGSAPAEAAPPVHKDH